MNVEYIVVQAGGKGTRMEKLTQNKPKALVPINNLPMIFHLFKKYPNSKYIIIGDYMYDVLEKYMKAFAEVNYEMVCATGKKGTCSGMRKALEYIPENKRFMLIWCDLVLPDEYQIPDTTQNVIGISKDFPCRWMYKDGEFKEERSQEQGVAGHFIFSNKSYLKDVPDEGEFVRWLQTKHYFFEEQALYRTHEYGIYDVWDKLPKMRCRPFNSMKFEGEKVYKVPVDAQGEALAKREVAWYKKLKGIQFDNLPVIYEYEPLCMEKIDGRNIYEYNDISLDDKKNILSGIVKCLKGVHDIECIASNEESYYDAYIGKTFARLEKVRQLVPFADEKTVKINGRVCRNVFYNRENLERQVMEYMPAKFCLIHGDCTFSNIMLKNDKTPILIDPRGYFGKTEIYGDVCYDWVKLYYSLVSNYDQFNLKRFDLNISENEVELKIASSHWEELEAYYFELLEGEASEIQLKLLLAIVWLSLTTYAWEDYDSICGAFYMGLYYLEEVLI